MKLGKIEQNVIKHGNFNEPECNIVFPDNICPECGHDITEYDKGCYEKDVARKVTFFGEYHGTEVTFTCPECRCEFIRTVYTEYEPDKVSTFTFFKAILSFVTIILLVYYIICHNTPLDMIFLISGMIGVVVCFIMWMFD